MNSLPFNAAIEKELEFLAAIKSVQVKLFRPGIESEFPDEEQKKQFKKLRLQWTLYVETVEIDIATVLLGKLQENEENLKNGIENIQKEIQKVDNTVGFLNLLGRIIEILGVVVKLAI
jgi:hypothetical protein